MTSLAPRSVRISKRTVDAAEAAPDRYILWDSELKGFGLRIEPSGTKTYVVRYRSGGGRRSASRQYVIGRHGPLTPEAARKQASMTLAAVALGRDPQADRREARKEMTVEELCDLYLEEGCLTKKASTLKIDRIRIARHIKPLLGRKKVSNVDRASIERFQSDVATGKTRDEATPHTRGGKAAATRAVGLLGGIFTFATSRRICATNPVKGVRRFKDGKRERFLSATELSRLGETLRAFEVEGMKDGYVRIFRLLALTGARKNEIAALRWREVDLERGLLRLADSKTGAKVILLGAPAQKLLADADQNTEFVFPDPSDPGMPIRGVDWAWVKVRIRAGLDDVRIHDLRHSFASFGLAGGQALPLIGKLLGHSHVATTSRYAHLADDPVRAAANSISGMISSVLSGEGADLQPLPFRNARW